MHHNHPDWDLPSEDEYLKLAQSHLTQETIPDSDISVWSLLSVGLELLFTECSDEEWLLRLRQFRNWDRSLQEKQSKAGGPNIKSTARFFVFAFVGHRTKIRGLSMHAACAEAALLFKLPIERVELWCIKKHRYGDERAAAEELVEIARCIRSSDDEIEAFLRLKIPSLFDQ